MHKTVFLGNVLGLGATARTWGTQDNDLWDTTWLALEVSDSEHLRDIIVNIIVTLLFRVVLSVLIDETLVCFFNTFNIQVVLINSLLCLCIKLRSIQGCVSSLQVFLYLLMEDTFTDLQDNHLIRYNAQLLQ